MWKNAVKRVERLDKIPKKVYNKKNYVFLRTK